MDIVDKVFEKLNLDYDADKERAHTARVRQKESLARKKARLGIFGGVAAVVITGAGLAIMLPQIGSRTTAESDINVVFKEDDQPIEQIVEKVSELATDSLENNQSAGGETASEPVATNNEATAVVSAARQAVRRATTVGGVQATNKTESVVHVIDSGEQLDQGKNDCQTVESGSTGVVLWCTERIISDDSESTTSATEDNKTNEPQEGEDEIKTED